MSKERPTYIKIGKIGRAIGRNGEVRASIDEHFKNKFDQIHHVFLEMEGQKVPYFIEYYFDEGDFIFKFDDIANPEETSPLVNTIVYLELSQVDKLKISKKVIKTSFEQFSILTAENQNIGIIHKIEEYPHQIMSFVTLADGKEVMIPLVEDWIMDVNMKKKYLIMDLPKGLVNFDEEE
ncbi:MAG: hypothetical protein KA767_07080 [Saprospiraceae bacterium]|nr:hypothetical protein [Saprospiraceae bacterium]MBP7643085.1 hypothetical protein [Saprospiraceae bacterium]